MKCGTVRRRPREDSGRIVKQVYKIRRKIRESAPSRIFCSVLICVLRYRGTLLSRLPLGACRTFPCKHAASYGVTRKRAEAAKGLMDATCLTMSCRLLGPIQYSGLIFVASRACSSERMPLLHFSFSDSPCPLHLFPFSLTVFRISDQEPYPG